MSKLVVVQLVGGGAYDAPAVGISQLCFFSVNTKDFETGRRERRPLQTCLSIVW